MELRLLEIGKETDQLSACSLSLLLGVFTPNNQIANFLCLAQKILQVEQAILSFHNEPYTWYSNAAVFKACFEHSQTNFKQFYQGEKVILPAHNQYENFVAYLAGLGIKATRLLGINLQNSEGESIGQVVLFDQHMEPFSLELTQMVLEFADQLMKYVNLKVDYADLKEQYEQVATLNSSKTKFFQIIAHDLRAPFHGLLGFSEVLAHESDDLDKSSMQNIAEYLLDTTQSTYNLLENLLSWSMADGGRFEYHPINFNIKQSSQIVWDVLEVLARKKNIQLIDDVPDDLKVYADIHMITSVLQNLVSNALKFTPTDGTGCVQLFAQQDEKYVHIYIQDTGLGMTPHQISKLFQPRLTASKKGTSGELGTGLGLLLCKRFIDLNLGEIEVKSKEGKGTTFKVSLPSALNHHQSVVPESPQKEN